MFSTTWIVLPLPYVKKIIVTCKLTELALLIIAHHPSWLQSHDSPITLILDSETLCTYLVKLIEAITLDAF